MVSNLSKSANEALLQSEDQSEDEPHEECDAGSNNDDDDNDNLQEMELAPETNLEFVLNHLNEEVIKLNPPPPPLHQGMKSQLFHHQ